MLYQDSKQGNQYCQSDKQKHSEGDNALEPDSAGKFRAAEGNKKTGATGHQKNNRNQWVKYQHTAPPISSGAVTLQPGRITVKADKSRVLLHFG